MTTYSMPRDDGWAAPTGRVVSAGAPTARLSSRALTCCALLSLGGSRRHLLLPTTSHSPGIMDLDPCTVCDPRCDHGAQSLRGHERAPQTHGRRAYTFTRARRTHTQRPLDRRMLLLVIERVVSS